MPDQPKTVMGVVTTNEPDEEFDEELERETAEQYREILRKRVRDAKPDPDARQGLLLRVIDRTPVRVLLVGDLGYRDLEGGVAFIDASDPAYDVMRAWAEANADVEIVDVKAGALICRVCGEHIEGGEDGLALHTFEFHVDSGETEETGKPPTSAARARAATRRKERVEKASQE